MILTSSNITVRKTHSHQTPQGAWISPGSPYCRVPLRRISAGRVAGCLECEREYPWEEEKEMGMIFEGVARASSPQVGLGPN